MTKVTNLSKATDLVKASIDANIPKADILASIMTELSVSKANAFVYFTKATKALGVSITTDKAPKVSKTKQTDQEKADEFFAKADARLKAKQEKANKVTELSPAKAKSKVKVIDSVIADMKPQSPFAALGV